MELGPTAGRLLQYRAMTYSGTGSVSDLPLALAFDAKIVTPPHRGLDGLSWIGTMFLDQTTP